MLDVVARSCTSGTQRCRPMPVFCLHARKTVLQLHKSTKCRYLLNNSTTSAGCRLLASAYCVLGLLSARATIHVAGACWAVRKTYRARWCRPPRSHRGSHSEVEVNMSLPEVEDTPEEGKFVERLV